MDNKSPVLRLKLMTVKKIQLRIRETRLFTEGEAPHKEELKESDMTVNPPKDLPAELVRAKDAMIVPKDEAAENAAR